MFELNIGNTPNLLTPRDFRDLGEKTEGYSGSDIAIVVRDALMQPIRKVQTATHFKQVNAPSRDDPSVYTPHLTPCSPGDPGAVEMTWMDVKSEELLEPDLNMQDFIRAVQTARPTVNKDDIKRHTSFTSDFGAWRVNSIFILSGGINCRATQWDRQCNVGWGRLVRGKERALFGCRRSWPVASRFLRDESCSPI
ncbi:hypothetical protein BC938DRAFT_476629 [Jimgerdemannia flammicorona]|uniref:Uncharacterized protein n=1 Tax=Jimgerdemannia flammicorona TaxID=994334 RepID=A0A433PFM3_9FUNG|nr:hypothetical protein BC938DRAFT_476629 [Jimgerdemannia flammicorona]